jgi:uncharacterized OB-fold protein
MTEQVTFPEWCDLVGTTTDAMAEAQERAEEEERTSTPIGRCEKCGRLLYAEAGFCGGCENERW